MGTTISTATSCFTGTADSRLGESRDTLAVKNTCNQRYYIDFDNRPKTYEKSSTHTVSIGGKCSSASASSGQDHEVPSLSGSDIKDNFSISPSPCENTTRLSVILPSELVDSSTTNGSKQSQRVIKISGDNYSINCITTPMGGDLFSPLSTGKFVSANPFLMLSPSSNR